MWETCVWLALSGRRLVRRADGSHAIIAAAERRPDDRDLTGRAVPCRIRLRDGTTAGRTLHGGASDLGIFDWEPVAGGANRWMYERDDPVADQAALREALPALYRSFAP